MSYILEALKKAQAERQLGEVPSVHAPAMQVGADAPAGGKLKTPMLAAMAVMAAVIVALLALVWRKGESPQPAPANPPAAATPVVAAPVTVAPVTAAPAAIAPPVVAPSSVAAQAAGTPLPAALPSPAAKPTAAPVASPAAAPVAAVKPPASASSGEEVTQTARDLPEPIQRALPPIVVGGYIYSKDPADRLLLIDKVLRHEGEEVAPGLVLEKLLPKSAVFSFKGYRYRVPY